MTAKTRKLYRYFATLLGGLLLFLSIPAYSSAAKQKGSGLMSNNIHDHAYEGNAKVANSYLVQNPDGTLTRLENFGNVFLTECYSGAFKLLTQGALFYELPYFGGFYAGANYNYFIFGQANSTKNANTEVIRIVRYTKNWVRVGSASLTNCNTTMPFTGCNTSFAEFGNLLYIRCGHTEYSGQQSTMTMTYDNSTNAFIDLQCAGGNGSTGANYNTAATYIGTANGRVTVCDDLNGKPAGVRMSTYGILSGIKQYAGNCWTMNALGDNGSLYKGTPFLSVGGMAVNTQYAIAVGTTTPMDGTSGSRNVFVATTPYGNFSSGAGQIKYLTGFAYDAKSCSTPYLIEVGGYYMVLWEEKNGYSDMEKVYYAMIDYKGDRVGDVKSVDGCLSDCTPIVYGNQVVWYTTNGREMMFYSIPLSGAMATTGTTVQPASVYGGVDYSYVYDYNYYVNAYPDIKMLYSSNPAGALAHFATVGIYEGRQGCENFNVYAYANRYPDLRNFYGINIVGYYQHFINYGYREGRSGR